MKNPNQIHQLIRWLLHMLIAFLKYLKQNSEVK